MKKTLLYFFCTAMLLVSLVACHNDKKNTKDKSKTTPVVTVKKNLLAEKYSRPRPGEFLRQVKPNRPAKTINIISYPIPNNIVIDTNSKDIENIWENIKPTETIDYMSSRIISIKSLHNDKYIYFLVKYPDAFPSETHKSMGWDYNENIYRQLGDREDMFVFKWSMSGNDVNLAFHRYDLLKPHIVDIWFWKAVRTNPAGYADDKMQIISTAREEDRVKLKGAGDKQLYLYRKGDQGSAAYKIVLPLKYSGDIVSRFKIEKPTGSRADIKAKGFWHDGYWIIKFARLLDTGHADDVQFKIGNSYLFGVSLYEMSGGEILKGTSQPLYRLGDVYDRLILKIK
ncbi:MAG: ethylbenzene dehydrogenase-related protein [Gammaproteobacteria bacterium]